MSDAATPDPVLAKLRPKLDAAYGNRLDRVVLFGSRARGDHRLDSDCDIAAFIRDPESRWDEMGRLALITTEFLLEDAFIAAFPIDAA